VFSLRDEFGPVGPAQQRPELWSLYTRACIPASTCAVPDQQLTELDVGSTSRASASTCPRSTRPSPPGRAPPRPARPVTPITPPRAGETVEEVSCASARWATSPVPARSSRCFDTETIHRGNPIARLTERGATRMDDRPRKASMEKEKEGYF